MSSSQAPLYRALADKLRAEIVSNGLVPGDQLPTEHDICASENVSRHTAREALRILAEDGLIERRRGSGTVVAAAGAPTFAQPIGDFDTILQYARDAKFDIQSIDDPPGDALEALGLDGAYKRYRGVRAADGQPPIALTTIYALAELAPDGTTARAQAGSLSEWIEGAHGVPVARMVQRMEAVALQAGDAEALGVPAGTAALRTLRRYRDGAERIILLSESLHPAGRFVYEMRLERARR